MKRVLITGGSGFIGRHCLGRLQTIAEEVHATTRNLIDGQQASGVHWHAVDLLKAEPIRDLMRRVRPTHLLHLAWNVDEGVYWTAPGNLQWLKSGIDLIEAFYENGGQRVVMAGSCSEYDLHQAHLAEKRSELKPESLYAGCKHSLQTVLDTYCRNARLSHAWGRIFFLYGPNEKPGRLVPSVIRALLARQKAKCSHGNQIRDYLHVADVADAFVKLLNSDLQGPVNIASGEPVMLKHIICKIADHIDGNQKGVQLGALPSSPNEPPVIVADVERLTAELDWRPAFSLDSGLLDTIDWWKTHLNNGQKVNSSDE